MVQYLMLCSINSSELESPFKKTIKDWNWNERFLITLIFIQCDKNVFWHYSATSSFCYTTSFSNETRCFLVVVQFLIFYWQKKCNLTYLIKRYRSKWIAFEPFEKSCKHKRMFRPIGIFLFGWVLIIRNVKRSI